MSENDYKAGVDLLILTDPNHPILKDLQKGYTYLNIEYLKLAVKKKKDVDKKGEMVLRKLSVKKGKLYAERARLSNSFHKYTKKPERAVISDNIRRIQDEIARVDIEIQYIKDGTMRQPAAIDSYHVPFDIEGKRKEIKLLQQKIRHARERIADYKKQEGKEKFIVKNEEKVKNWKTQVARLKSALATET